MPRLPFLLTSFLLLLTGCSFFTDEEEDTWNDYESVYAYTAYDTTGQILVTGKLRILDKPNDVGDNLLSFLSGSWDLKAEQREAKTGPQVGEGKLEGTVIWDDGEEKIQINLNPHIADDNVFLEGNYADDESGDFAGRWVHEAYTNEPSSLPSGTFVAELVRRPKRTLIVP